MQSKQALALAKEEGLDLVLVSATAQPPVCKIIDFGRHKYETEKLKKDKKSKQQDVKGIKISPRIAEHDLTFMIRNAIRFLEEGHKVKVTCQFKAREVTHPELGRKKLDFFADQVKDLGVVERPPTLDGRLMVMVLNPKPQTGKPKNAKVENQQNGGEAVQDLGIRKDSATEIGEQPPVPAQERIAEATP